MIQGLLDESIPLDDTHIAAAKSCIVYHIVSDDSTPSSVVSPSSIFL